MEPSNDATSPRGPAHECLERAYAYQDGGALEDALRACKAALRLDPDLAEAHNLRGILLEELGRGREALAAYREAVRLDPDLVEARENLSEAEAELGDQADDLPVPVEEVQLPGEELSWIEVWTRALTCPSVETFQALLRDPKASAARGYRWMLLCGLVASTISGLAAYLVFGPGAGGVVCLPVQVAMGGIGAVLVLGIRAGITQWLARVFEGTGKYADLVYAIAAYSAPLTIVVSLAVVVILVSYMPCLYGVFLPLAIADVVLEAMAVKAVHRFGWAEAIGASLIPIAALLIPVGLLLLLYPFITYILWRL